MTTNRKRRTVDVFVEGDKKDVRRINVANCSDWNDFLDAVNRKFELGQAAQFLAHDGKEKAEKIDEQRAFCIIAGNARVEDLDEVEDGDLLKVVPTSGEQNAHSNLDRASQESSQADENVARFLFIAIITLVSGFIFFNLTQNVFLGVGEATLLVDSSGEVDEETARFLGDKSKLKVAVLTVAAAAHSATLLSEYGEMKAAYVQPISLDNKKRYCYVHGCDVIMAGTAEGVRDDHRSSRWNKIAWLLQLWEHYDVIIWMDLDTMWTPRALDFYVLDLLDLSYDLHFTPDLNTEERVNTGVFAVRTTPWAKQFFRQVWDDADSGRGQSDQKSINFILSKLSYVDFSTRVQQYDRRLLNAFPKVANEYVPIDGFSLQSEEADGDEVPNTLVLHFAGLFGGARSSDGRTPDTMLIQFLATLVNRHIKFLEAYEGSTGPWTRGGSIIRAWWSYGTWLVGATELRGNEELVRLEKEVGILVRYSPPFASMISVAELRESLRSIASLLQECRDTYLVGFIGWKKRTFGWSGWEEKMYLKDMEAGHFTGGLAVLTTSVEEFKATPAKEFCNAALVLWDVGEQIGTLMSKVSSVVLPDNPQSPHHLLCTPPDFVNGSRNVNAEKLASLRLLAWEQGWTGKDGTNVPSQDKDQQNLDAKLMMVSFTVQQMSTPIEGVHFHPASARAFSNFGNTASQFGYTTLLHGVDVDRINDGGGVHDELEMHVAVLACGYIGNGVIFSRNTYFPRFKTLAYGESQRESQHRPQQGTGLRGTVVAELSPSRSCCWDALMTAGDLQFPTHALPHNLSGTSNALPSDCCRRQKGGHRLRSEQQPGSDRELELLRFPRIVDAVFPRVPALEARHGSSMQQYLTRCAAVAEISWILTAVDLVPKSSLVLVSDDLTDWQVDMLQHFIPRDDADGNISHDRNEAEKSPHRLLPSNLIYDHAQRLFYGAEVIFPFGMHCGHEQGSLACMHASSPSWGSNIGKEGSFADIRKGLLRTTVGDDFVAEQAHHVEALEYGIVLILGAPPVEGNVSDGDVQSGSIERTLLEMTTQLEGSLQSLRYSDPNMNLWNGATHVDLNVTVKFVPWEDLSDISNSPASHVTNLLQLFGRAKVVVSPTTEALFYLPFCTPGTSVIELTPSFNKNDFFPGLFNVAAFVKRLGLPHLLLEVQGKSGSSMVDTLAHLVTTKLLEIEINRIQKYDAEFGHGNGGGIGEVPIRIPGPTEEPELMPVAWGVEVT
jgi:hypothetical protein